MFHVLFQGSAIASVYAIVSLSANGTFGVGVVASLFFFYNPTYLFFLSLYNKSSGIPTCGIPLEGTVAFSATVTE